jgi:hypothetical protein
MAAPIPLRRRFQFRHLRVLSVLTTPGRHASALIPTSMRAVALVPTARPARWRPQTHWSQRRGSQLANPPRAVRVSGHSTNIVNCTAAELMASTSPDLVILASASVTDSVETKHNATTRRRCIAGGMVAICCCCAMTAIAGVAGVLGHENESPTMKHPEAVGNLNVNFLVGTLATFGRSID